MVSPPIPHAVLELQANLTAEGGPSSSSSEEQEDGFHGMDPLQGGSPPLSGSDLFGHSTTENDEEKAEDDEEEYEEAEEEEKETDACVEDTQDGQWCAQLKGQLTGLSPMSEAAVRKNFEKLATSVAALCNFSRGEPQPQNKMADHFQLHQSNMLHPGLSRYQHLAPSFHSNIPIVLLSARPRYHKSYNYVFVVWSP